MKRVVLQWINYEALLFWIALSMMACTGTDNATKLAYVVEKAAKQMQNQQINTELCLKYVPTKYPEKPYTIIFFPDSVTTQQDLVSSGLSEDVAGLIFKDLAYLDIGNYSTLVVYQPEDYLSFTTYWRRFAQVEELIIWSKVGPSEVVVRKERDFIRIVGFRN